MSFFSPTYPSELSQTVKDFEQKTSAELVVVVAKHSHDYPNGAWLTATIGSFTAFSLFMLLDYEFYDNHIFLGTVLTFPVLFSLVYLLPPLKRLLIPKRQIQHFVDTAANSIFSGEMLYNTRERTGILLYISLLEREARIIADSGVRSALPAQKLEQLHQDLELCLSALNPSAALLHTINLYAPDFAEALPPRPDDIDELSNEPQQFLRSGFGAKSFKIKPTQKG